MMAAMTCTDMLFVIFFPFFWFISKIEIPPVPDELILLGLNCVSRFERELRHL